MHCLSEVLCSTNIIKFIILFHLLYMYTLLYFAFVHGGGSYFWQRPDWIISKENSFTIYYSSPMNMTGLFAPRIYLWGLAIPIVSTYTNRTCKCKKISIKLRAVTLYEITFIHSNNRVCGSDGFCCCCFTNTFHGMYASSLDKATMTNTGRQINHTNPMDTVHSNKSK